MSEPQQQSEKNGATAQPNAKPKRQRKPWEERTRQEREQSVFRTVQNALEKIADDPEAQRRIARYAFEAADANARNLATQTQQQPPAQAASPLGRFMNGG